MSAAAAIGGKPRGKREVIDVLEPKPKDKRLDKLINVRKQRLNRLERERREAREAWRESREYLRESKFAWREAKQAAVDFWQEARAGFLSMVMTSGQYRKAKAIYARMKEEAAQKHMECHEQVNACRAAKQAFFEARQRVIDGNKQQEKLSILRDEMRKLEAVIE